MDDQHLDQALAAMGRKRMAVADPPALHERAMAVPLRTQSRSGLLPSLTWRFGPMFSATKFVVAGAIVALLGGFLLVQPLDQRGATAPGSASAASPQLSEVGCDQLDGDLTSLGDVTDLLPRCLYFTDFASFQVPTSGWSYRPFGGPGGVRGDSWSVTKGDSAIFFLVRATPDGTYADPCDQVRGEPVSLQADEGDAILQHSADLLTAMSSIPGIEVLEGPSEVVEPDGYDGDVPAGHLVLPTNHLVFHIPEDACMPFGLWWDSDLGSRRVTRAGDTISIWIYNHPFVRRFEDPLRLWIEAETRGAADPGLYDEIQQILDSIGTPG